MTGGTRGNMPRFPAPGKQKHPVATDRRIQRLHPGRQVASVPACPVPSMSSLNFSKPSKPAG